jgi:hypothetical protein
MFDNRTLIQLEHLRKTLIWKLGEVQLELERRHKPRSAPSAVIEKRSRRRTSPRVKSPPSLIRQLKSGLRSGAALSKLPHRTGG